MRPVAICCLLLLALAGLAITPSAAAAPPVPACNGVWAVRETVGPVTVFASPPCYEITIGAASCPLSSEKTTTARAGNIAVHVKTCDSVEAASAAPGQPCTCPPPRCANPVDTTGVLAQVVRVTLTSDCRVIVTVLYGVVACSDPLDGAKAVSVGSVTVVLPCGQIDSCEPPMECYPTSAAIEPPVCGPDQMCTEPELPLCASRDLCNDAGCPYPVGNERGTDLTVGGLRVTHACGPQDLCSGPMRCTNPLSTAAVAIPPVCIEREAAAGPVSAGFDSCRQDHESYPCYSVQRIHEYEQAGPVWAQVHACLPHSPPPTAAAAPPRPCGVQQRCPAPVPLCSGVNSPSPAILEVSSNCHVYVELDHMDCLFGEEHHNVDAANLHVHYTTCSGPQEVQAAAAPPCTCPPPQPLCRPVNQLIADSDDAVDFALSDSCRPTVTIDLTYYAECVWGHDEAIVAGPVTVVYPVCEGPCGGATCPPPVDSTMMADPFPTCIRECSPLPSEACELRDATPSPLLHPLWGYDCTLDVHTACTGGASGSTDARVGFVDVSLARCSGPAWG